MTPEEQEELSRQKAFADAKMINEILNVVAKSSAAVIEKQNLAQKPEKKLTEEQKEIQEIREELMLKLKSTKLTTVTFDDVIGVNDAKHGLDIALGRQNIYVRCYEQGDLVRCKGIMLYG